MKTYILLVTLLVIIFCHWTSASSTGVEQRQTSAMVGFIGRKLKNLWTWIWDKRQEEGFVARCFGAARKLKFVMPMMIFKLGVIVTILVFLTIFSMKSLGLLLLLVMLNSGGLAAKWASAKHGNKQWTQPQNLHFHLNSKDYAKDGHYASHSDYEQGWYDRSDVGDTEYESLDERLKRLNVYDSYYSKY